MRGYQKRVIFVKNTGSRHIEEAYFVMRSDELGNKASRALIVEEADRIIRERFGDRRAGFIFKNKRYLLSFFVGCAVTLAICFIAWIALL